MQLETPLLPTQAGLPSPARVADPALRTCDVDVDVPGQSVRLAGRLDVHSAADVRSALLAAVEAGYPVAVPERAPSGMRVKLSAAWLIENAGIRRGFALPGSAAAISSKHTLALTNRGGATAEQIAELARYVQGRVLAEFGVLLQPEPVLVGVAL